MCSTHEQQTTTSGTGQATEVNSDNDSNHKLKQDRFCAPLSDYFSFDWLSKLFKPAGSNECTSSGFNLSSREADAVVSNDARPIDLHDSDLFHIESSGIRHSLSLGENMVPPQPQLLDPKS